MTVFSAARRRLLLLAACAALAFAAPAAQAQTPDGPEGSPHRERVYRIPHSLDEGRSLAAIVYRAPGEEARPLAIFTHHTSATPQNNAEPRHGVYPHVVTWLIERGFTVAVVHRRGYGLTGGERAERFQCRRPNHAGSAREDAADLMVAIEALTTLPYVRKTGVVAFGQSTGGWAVAALAAENHPQVAGIVNFVGGRRGVAAETRQPCALDELVRDAAVLGRRARTPALWIYSQNDRLFAAELTRRMSEAYQGAGGKLDFVMLPPFGQDGHAIMTNPRGMSGWAPHVERFLAANR